MDINIGELIEEEMKRQGITYTQLAKEIGCVYSVPLIPLKNE